METRKQYQARYMRRYRAKNPEYKERERRWDREYKKMKRRTDPEWLARERARRREYGKYRSERNKEKQAKNHRDYAKKNRIKERARSVVNKAVKERILKRPKRCMICGKIPKLIPGKSVGLRADHYKGYKKENWLIVRWICIDCDGKQLRSKKELVYD